MTHRPIPLFRRRATGFSLVELMISIALALIILLGVNYVFRSTQKTVSTGMALSSQVRTQHAASDSIRNDFISAVSAAQQPVIAIHSSSVVAFQSRNDQLTDKDGLASTLDIDGNGIENESGVPGENAMTWPGVYTSRRHRVDTLSFFASGKFHRQTGQPAPGSEVLVSNMDSHEAWIWYGHAALPDKAGTNYYGPAQPSTTNPPEFIATPGNYTGAFATDWVLGRVAMLLVTPDSTGQIYDANGIPQVFFDAFSDKTPADPLWPLAYNALSVAKQKTLPSQAKNYHYPQESAFDLAGTDIQTFRTIVENVSNVSSLDPLYPYNVNWWRTLVYKDSTGTSPEYRFDVNPFPILNPANIPPTSSLSLEMAKTTPALIKGCTQFIVEFAGDFVTQDNAGNVVAPVTSSPYYPGDGIIDYYIPDSTKPNERRIRWYGAQRDIGSAPTSTYKGFPNGVIEPAYDIVPLSLTPGYSTFAASYKYDGTAYGGFEKEVAATSPYIYTCAWGPNDKIKPKMIRVTVETTDPLGRLSEPRVEQYVMTLK